MSNKSF